MSVEIKAAPTAPPVAVVGIGYYADLTPSDESAPLLDSALFELTAFDGKRGQVKLVAGPTSAVLLVGLGDRTTATNDTFRRAAAQFVKEAQRFATASLFIGGDAQAVGEGLVLGGYKFDKYKSKNETPKLETITVVGADTNALAIGVSVANAVALARDLINGPACDVTPTHLGEVATEIAQNDALQIEVWDKERIESERLGGLLGVSRGSSEPPRMIKMLYSPDGATKTVAIVGKGITFDSGGLSIKSGDGMMTMKTDMSGAAAVIATMSVLPLLAPNVRVVGIAVATENVIGPQATKPGDVLTARNGKTMEVLNTDAEGRLVLADGLSLAVEEGADAIVDLATLTGACKVALGGEIAGLFSNNDELAQKVQLAAASVGEQVWPLPLQRSYRKFIDSEIADIKNIGSGGAGATTAALFLEEFVGDTPWVHLDIAGPARADSDDGYTSKGGTGFGVRTLLELISRY